MTGSELTTDEVLAFRRGMKALTDAIRRLDRRLRILQKQVYPDSGRKVKREQVDTALMATDGNVSNAARLLRIHRRQMQRLMLAYGLRKANERLSPDPPAPSREVRGTQ
jgi:ActR/RegA family two-component response regulator